MPKTNSVNRPTISSKFTIFLLLIILLFSAFLRFYQLSAIKEPIFDEVYFPVFANDYVTGNDFYDAHPPLGKLIIAGGIKLWGNNPFGWRVMNAATGLLLILTIYLFAYSLTKKREVGLIAAFLVAIDPVALVESRVGLINIYLALFSLLSLWFFWRWWDAEQKSTWNFALTCICIGLATAVKWIGIGTFGAILVFLAVRKLQRKPLGLGLRHIALLFLIPLTYLIVFIPEFIRHNDTFWWNYLITWHKDTFNYHAHLDATHPYGSSWWTWPLSLRPLWMYYKSPSEGSIVGIIEIGNLVTWITGLAAILTYIVKPKLLIGNKQNEKYLFLVLVYVSLYLPWAGITRVAFIYHYFVPVLVLLVFLASVIYDQLLTQIDWRWSGIAILMFGTAFFVYFLPLLLGMKVHSRVYEQHMWMQKQCYEGAPFLRKATGNRLSQLCIPGWI